MFAFHGAKTLLVSQHNAWIHAAATIVVVGGGLVYRISAHDWALIVFAVALVWMAEAMNSAIEFLADEVSLEKRDRIKKAKDLGACGVLVGSIAALIIGVIVFWPHMIQPR